VLVRFGFLAISPCVSAVGETRPSSELRWLLRCACSLWELIGCKKACDVRDGTWVLLAEVGGRVLAAPTLPATLPAPIPAVHREFPLEGEACDHAPGFDDRPVATLAVDEGRDGGSPGSPTGPVRLCTRPPDARASRLGTGGASAATAAPPNCESMSLIRDEIALRASDSETASGGIGKELLAGEWGEVGRAEVLIARVQAVGLEGDSCSLAAISMASCTAHPALTVHSMTRWSASVVRSVVAR